MVPGKNASLAEKAKFKRQCRIYIAVVVIHILVLGGPFVLWLFSDYFKPKQEKVIQIDLYELPLSNEPAGAAGGNPPPPSPETQNTPNEQTSPEPPAPTPPPPPTPPTPKQPKKPVVKPPEIKKPTPKKPVVKPPEITPPKEQKKTEKKPEKKFLDPKEITISDKTVSKSKNMPKTKSKDFDKPYSPPNGTGKSSDLAQRLGKIADQPPGNGGGNPDVAGMAATYGQTLAAYIKPRWQQPNQYELNHTKPFVIVKFYISPSGNVMGAQITTPSNVPAMDRSVQKLLNSMRMVPPPPAGVNTIEIRMQIED